MDTSVDPMTVVARGAAIYASTQEIPDEFIDEGVELSVDATTVTLEYERVSKLPTCFVAGKVEGPTVEEGGLSVEISRNDGRWKTEMLPVGEDGFFQSDLVLIDEGKPCMSQFTTRVLDASGRIVVSVDEPQIWFRYPEGKARLANSLRVGVAGNNTEILVRQGAALPAEGQERFVTQKPLRQGSGDDVLRIAVLEGVTHLFGDEDDYADCNVHVGTLTIHGDDERITMDLPQDSEIVVTIRQDSSRQVQCVAYIPLLDEEFEAIISPESFKVDRESVQKRFDELRDRVKEVEALQRDVPVAGLDELLDVVRRLHTVDEIDKELQRAEQGETEAFHRAYRRVQELAGAMNRINDMQRQARIKKRVGALKKAVDSTDAEALAEIQGEFKKAVGENDDKALRRIEKSLDEMDSRVRRGAVLRPPARRSCLERDAGHQRAACRLRGSRGAAQADRRAGRPGDTDRCQPARTRGPSPEARPHAQ